MDERTISVRVGELFHISLDSNPSTGYSWAANFEENEVMLEKRTYRTESSLIGGGGKETFTFRSLTKGETTITMKYKRPWEENEIDIRLFRISSS
ncbi:MAG: protease inhibitor I42 family protein [Methanomassiliicoccales archaeon]|nr:protease inhibitor I42 family protein [Methanomassiliicoccales archaeon]